MPLPVGARYYDPEFGCFLTRDTELGQKPYTYCDGDPVNLSDPSGHKPKKGTPPIVAPTPSTPIPIGNTGATYIPGSDTLTLPPTGTPSSGTATGSVDNVSNGKPLRLGGILNQPFGGGNFSLSGVYNFANGSSSTTGNYTHSFGGGFSGGVSFGTGEVPGYTLKYGLSF